MWRLKKDQPAFEMVDGPMAGKVYVHGGEEYEVIPEGLSDRFEKVGKTSGGAAVAAPMSIKKEQISEDMTNAEQPS